MVQPFYWTYNIDDSALSCNSVITADCDGTHRYKKVCDLISECLPDPQLTNQCIVDFFNSDLSNRRWEYLKVNNNGCLTTWTPDCPCDDRKVAATNWDTSPDTLDKKLIWWKNGPYEITVSTPTSRVVQVIPKWPINWFINFTWPMPDCDEAEVKMKRDWSVYVQCPEIKKWMRFAQMRHLGWQATVERNKTVRISAPNEGESWSWYTFTWGRDIMATDWFAKWTGNDVILIQEPWLYQFSYDMYIRRDKQYIYAIRAGLQIDWMEMWDFKYNWPWRSTHADQDQYKVINHAFPDEDTYSWWAMALWLTWASFSWSYYQVIPNASVRNPVAVRLQVKPDTRTFDPREVSWDKKVTLYLTDSTAERGPFTYISILRVDEDPTAYGYHTL